MSNLQTYYDFKLDFKRVKYFALFNMNRIWELSSYYFDIIIIYFLYVKSEKYMELHKMIIYYSVFTVWKHAETCGITEKCNTRDSFRTMLKYHQM